MNSLINRTCEMFVRVLSFTSERTDAFLNSPVGVQSIAELKKIVEELTKASTTQTSGLSSVQRATSERITARETLYATMKAIARTARAIAIDMPGVEIKFRLPRSGSDPVLLQVARAFADDLLPLKAEFVSYGMSESFIDDFKGEIAALDRAMGKQHTGRDAHITATASVESAVERGMNAVRKLHAIVHNKFHDDPATLAAWASAHHIENAPRSRKRPNNGKDDANLGTVPSPDAEPKEPSTAPAK